MIPQPAHPVQPALVSSAGERCPSCGTHMAVDQRYCLHCGQRRGDPRLPFMDAVTFMDAATRPPQAAAAAPAPSGRKPRISANASLIAGVGTLLLAMGIGVLIGKTGEGSSNAGTGAPQVIKVGGGAGAETATTAKGGEGGSGAKASASSGGGGGKKAAEAKSKIGSSGQTKGVEEVLKPVNGVKLPPPTVEKGGSCESGTAGCEGGKFNGNFFE
jgi:hypothetical protein